MWVCAHPASRLDLCPPLQNNNRDIARKEKLIPPDKWTINTAGFDSAYFDSAYFDTEDVVVSAALRTQNIFVDWKDGEWVHGTILEVARVKDFADSIIQSLDKLEGKSS
jgi:hypothetical protein